MPDLSPDQAHQLAVALSVLLVIVLLVDAGLFIAWALRKGKVDAGLAPPLFAPRWSLVDVWIAGQFILCLLLGMVVVVFVGIALVRLMFGLRSTPTGLSINLLLWSLMAQNVVLALVPILIITRKYGTPMQQIGLPTHPSARDWGIGLAAGVALIGVGAVLEFSLTWFVKHLLPPDSSRALTDLSKSLGNEGVLHSVREPGLFLLLLLAGGIGAPIGEEIFFRGFLYNCAKRRLGLLGGTLLSAGVFALAHVSPLQVVGIFVMGVLLAVIYERSGSLWVTILMHAVNNSVGLLLVYFVPGV